MNKILELGYSFSSRPWKHISLPVPLHMGRIRSDLNENNYKLYIFFTLYNG